MSIPTIVIGAQWGDEGKGKIVDYLAEKADYVVRYNGGNNAGHTVVLKGERFPLSLLPSGVLWKKKLFIAQGVVINPKILINEIKFFEERFGRINLCIDERANIVMPYHQWLDAASEESKGKNKVGSLKLGIGYCYEDRNNRHGIRLEDLIDPKILREKLNEEYPLKVKRLKGVFNFSPLMTIDGIYNEYKKYGALLKKYAGDVSLIISKNIRDKKVLFEGAHGTFLDANFGTYPFTTAVNTISGGVFSYVGIPPQQLNVIGIVKAYTTRVGGGPFPAELKDNTGDYIQEKGGEFGTVSKRRRRCGWLDLPMLRLATRLNGFNLLAITKLDILTGLKELKIVTHYLLNGNKLKEFPSLLKDVEKVKPVFKSFRGWTGDIFQAKKLTDLPKECREYLNFIEKDLNVPIKLVSVAAERSAIINI